MTPKLDWNQNNTEMYARGIAGTYFIVGYEEPKPALFFYEGYNHTATEQRTSHHSNPMVNIGFVSLVGLVSIAEQHNAEQLDSLCQTATDNYIRMHEAIHQTLMTYEEAVKGFAQVVKDDYYGSVDCLPWNFKDFYNKGKQGRVIDLIEVGERCCVNVAGSGGVLFALSESGKFIGVAIGKHNAIKFVFGRQLAINFDVILIDEPVSFDGLVSLLSKPFTPQESSSGYDS